MDDVLGVKMKWVKENVSEWCDFIALNSFDSKISSKNLRKNYHHQIGDVFIGFAQDTIASLVIQFSEELGLEDETNEPVWEDLAGTIIEKIKYSLLQCASSDNIIRLSSNKKESSMPDTIRDVVDIYFNKQCHQSFLSFWQSLCNSLIDSNFSSSKFIQLTTHSRLLTSDDLISESYGINLLTKTKICIESLLAFNKETQFVEVLHKFLDDINASDSDCQNVLLIQCECGNFYSDRISSARYTIYEECSKWLLKTQSPVNFRIFLIIQLPKISGGGGIVGFQTSRWLCFHIDDLQDDFKTGNLIAYQDKKLS
jgi:hypothetical protein